MKVIAITNRKGGVGKTTTAVNVPPVLVELGQKVLLIDLDTQRNASLHLGVRLDPSEPSPVHRVLSGGRPLVEQARATPFGFDLLAAHKDLDEAADKMRRALAGRGHFVLREALEEVPPGRWDTVLLDCPPSIGDMTTAALIAADVALIPMPMQPFPYEGLVEVMDLVKEVQRYHNPRLRIGGVFATLIDDNTVLSTTTRGEVEDLCESQVMAQRVRRNNALAEASKKGTPVYNHKPDCNGARDYRALVGELVARGVA